MSEHPFIWTHTKLTNAERCPKQFHARYIAKTLPYTSSPEADEGNRVHKLMEDRIKFNRPLPEAECWREEFIMPKTSPVDNALAEHELAVTADGEPVDFWDKRAWFRGKLDYLLMSADKSLAVITDWKTGRVWEDPDELETHGALAAITYPAVEEWWGMYVWFKERRMGQPHVLDGKTAFHNLRKRVDVIDLNCQDAGPSPLCRFCPLEQECRGGKK